MKVLKGFIVLGLIALLAVGIIMTAGCSQKESAREETSEIETVDSIAEDANKGESEEKAGKGETSMTDQTSFSLESPAFEDGDDIPAKYANVAVPGGQNVSIPLAWKKAPEGTKSFVFAMIDRHKVANNWIHWLVVNIPADVNSIQEGASRSTNLPRGAKELNNTFGSVGYGGPQPPPGTGPHDYETVIYALDVENIDLPEDMTANELERVLEGESLATATLVGRLEKQL